MPKELVAIKHNGPDLGPASFVQGAVYVTWLKGLDYIQINLYSQEEPGVVQELYSPKLSRSEINKLIKTLRRARDQVYGKDE